MTALLWLSCRSAPVIEPLVLTLRTAEDIDTAKEQLIALGYQEQKPPPVHISLETSVSLVSLGYIGWPHPLEIEIDGHGRTLPRDSQLAVEGARVTVRGLRHPGGKQPRSLLRIDATERITLEDLHILDAPDHERTARGIGPQSHAIELLASGPAVRVDASRVDVLDAKGSAAVALVPDGGRFEDARWSEGRFGGNVAPELLAAVLSLSAPGTLHMGTGPLLDERHAPLVIRERWSELPYDEAVLERWRREALGQDP